MDRQTETVRGDYEYKKDKALKKVADVLEECLGNFHGEDAPRIREAIANFTIGYLGVSFGLHAPR